MADWHGRWRKPAETPAPLALIPLAHRRQLTPVDPIQVVFPGVETRASYIVDHTGEADETAHCLLRWVATAGETGSWSEAATATIGP